MCHIDLAAGARVKPPTKKPTADDVDEDDDSDDDEAKGRRASAMEFEDVGGVVPDDDDEEEAEVAEVSAHPVRDHHGALALVFQREHFQKLRMQTRLTKEDKQLLQFDAVYGAIAREHLALAAAPRRTDRRQVRG